MPYEAAKAVAATFCWDIRHVLTPLFGTGFPSLCVPPADQAHFGRMIIDPTIVRRATETANYYRSLELQSQTLSGDLQNESTTSPSYLRRAREAEESSATEDHPRQIITKFPRRRYTSSIGSQRDSSSEPYCVSPQSPTGSSTWTPVNAPPPRSSGIIPRSRVPSPDHFYRRAVELRKNHLSPEESESDTDLSSVSPSGAIRAPECSSLNEDADMEEVDSGSADVGSSESFSEMSLSEEDMSVDDDGDEEYRGPNARLPVTGESPSEKGRLEKGSLRSVKNSDGAPRSRHFAHEVKAAHALLHLHMQEATSEGSGNDAPADESACRSTLGLAIRPSSLASSRKRRRASL